ncbi:MAG: hypothetical protein A4S09_16000 [Proteobacteria bacterium SG_bin7]|nr:MAG: hypothetical protein A4S09_16000 [Proteobacteria bacterium SG_bin7]
MKKFFVLICLISIFSVAAFSQSSEDISTSVDNSSFYRDRPSYQMPKGTLVKFNVDLFIPANETKISMPFKTRQECYFATEDSLKRDYDQLLAAGTTQNVVRGEEWGIRLNIDPNIHIYCDTDKGDKFKTVGEIVDVFSGPMTFEFPDPQKAPRFKFP